MTASYSKIFNLQAGKTKYDLVIYYNEDFLKPKGIEVVLGFKAIPTTCVPGAASGYSAGGNILVICPHIWEEFGAPSKQVIGDVRTNDLTGEWMDRLLTISGILLHELLHAATYGELRAPGGQKQSSIIDLAVSYDDAYPGRPSQAKTVSGYKYLNCHVIAAKDSIAQRRRPLTSANGNLDALNAAMNGQGRVDPRFPASTPGITVWNADSLRLFALRESSLFIWTWRVICELVG